MNKDDIPVILMETADYEKWSGQRADRSVPWKETIPGQFHALHVKMDALRKAVRVLNDLHFNPPAKL